MTPSLKLCLHQAHHTIADFPYLQDNFTQIFRQAIQQDAQDKSASLHIFPELALCGYPLQDLCLQRSFIDQYQYFLQQLNELALSFPPGDQHSPSPTFLLGGLDYEWDQQGQIAAIKNVIFSLAPGQKLKRIYSKRLLPNYDIFDEKKYFTPGKEAVLWPWRGKNIALLICEDMWPSAVEGISPLAETKKLAQDQHSTIHLVACLNASPFWVGKQQERLTQAQHIAQCVQAPLVYVNRVGGEDGIIFDGASFILNCQGKLWMAPSFSAGIFPYAWSDLTVSDSVTVSVSQDKKVSEKSEKSDQKTQYRMQIDFTVTPPLLRPLEQPELQQILDTLIFGLKEYMQKNGSGKVLVGVSGGIDSGVVLALAKIALPEAGAVEAIYLPSKYSAALSLELSEELCRQWQVPLKILPIKFLHATTQNIMRDYLQMNLQGLADENIQSRLRGLLLYTYSNMTGAMVLNTSNKSELAVGYSTLYGDSVGAISLLGDLYKSEVYQLAHYLNGINGTHQNRIPLAMISRAPSAELRENQEDAQSLPPYSLLDCILEGILSYQMGEKQLAAAGLPLAQIKKTLCLYKNSEYKRKQFCPIIKVKAKSFGFGHRNPISKGAQVYSNIESLTYKQHTETRESLCQN